MTVWPQTFGRRFAGVANAKTKLFSRLLIGPALAACLVLGGPSARAQQAQSERAPESGASADDYLDDLRRHFMMREYKEVLQIADEIEERFPRERVVVYYRSQSQLRINEESDENKSPFRSMRERPVVLEKPEATPTPIPAPAEPEIAMITPPPSGGSFFGGVSDLLESVNDFAADNFPWVIGIGGALIVLLAIVLMITRRRKTDEEAEDELSEDEEDGPEAEVDTDQAPPAASPPVMDPLTGEPVMAELEYETQKEAEQPPAVEDGSLSFETEEPEQTESIRAEKPPWETASETKTAPGQPEPPPDEATVELQIVEPVTEETHRAKFVSPEVEATSEATSAESAELRDIPSLESADTGTALPEPSAEDEDTQFKFDSPGEESAESAQTSIDLENAETQGLSEETHQLSPEEIEEQVDLINLEGPDEPPPPPARDETTQADLSGGPAEPEPEHREGVQVFHKDETVRVDVEDKDAEETIDPRMAETSTGSAPAHEEPFEREQRIGMDAFKQARWDQAVHHLSIAAALRPEASEVKENLRRARRMRKGRS